eukprot:NODE_626_length_2237_cov_67.497635_g596_i0.p1 GENE.NODE_626_length_2237_cov_67.497635_g596_i0~~NODE_626_length_2237_cov_67.497635_g596_i0.p1  ORF type:complete len:157 (+),score=10.58 NODE_626_length_2237_cov_67.497635_g596_i0:1582-2052(+)
MKISRLKQALTQGTMIGLQCLLVDSDARHDALLTVRNAGQLATLLKYLRTLEGGPPLDVTGLAGDDPIRHHIDFDKPPNFKIGTELVVTTDAFQLKHTIKGHELEAKESMKKLLVSENHSHISPSLFPLYALAGAVVRIPTGSTHVPYGEGNVGEG